MLRKGEIRKQKSPPALKKEELPFVAPQNWEWVRLFDLSKEITSGSRGWAEFYSAQGSKFIRAQNIRFGKLDLKEIAYVELPESVEGKRTSVEKGDLLLVITGAGVTNPALLDQELGETFVSQHVGLVKVVNPEISNWILFCLMAESACRGELLDKAYGAGRPGLNLNTIRSLKVPIPPIPEQQRIIAKIGELTALCDQLESRLTQNETTAQRLLESTLHAALNGSPPPAPRP